MFCTESGACSLECVFLEVCLSTSIDFSVSLLPPIPPPLLSQNSVWTDMTLSLRARALSLFLSSSFRLPNQNIKSWRLALYSHAPSCYLRPVQCQCIPPRPTPQPVVRAPTPTLIAPKEGTHKSALKKRPTLVRNTSLAGITPFGSRPSSGRRTRPPCRPEHSRRASPRPCAPMKIISRPPSPP